jgi:hypothetical protein
MLDLHRAVADLGYTGARLSGDEGGSGQIHQLIIGRELVGVRAFA